LSCKETLTQKGKKFAFCKVWAFFHFSTNWMLMFIIVAPGKLL
jgi:RNA polymerase subunit RPABC4/transcription elongation factor Spt4